MSTLLQISYSDQSVAASHSYADQRAPLTTAANDYARTVIEGGLIGALSGAAVGAVLGALTGDTRNIARGAIAGGIAGGAGGIIDGVNVAEKKKSYAAAEDGLNSAIEKARAHNEKLSSVVRTADRLVAVRRTELAELKSDTSSERRRELQRALQDDNQVLDDTISKAKSERDALKSLLDQSRSAPRSSSLQHEVSANDRAIERLSADKAAISKLEAAQ